MRLLAVAAVVAAAAVGVVLLAGGGDDPPAPTTAGCRDVSDSLLPKWARTGFSSREAAVIPHAIGRRGSIAAVVFGWPLQAPPGRDRVNKILWVPKRTADVGPLRIAARRGGTGPVVHRVIDDGPGPSSVDLPEPGCWHLELHWANGRDSLDLPYRAS